MIREIILVSGYLLIFECGVVSSGETRCYKISNPDDEAKFSAFLTRFMKKKEGKRTTVSTAFCVDAEDIAADDIDVIKNLTRQLFESHKESDTRDKAMMSAITDTNAQIVEIKKVQKEEKLDIQKMITDFQELKMEIRKATDGMRCSVDGMTKTRFGCFMGVRMGFSWPKARQHCTALGLDLASFEQFNEKSQLQQIEADLRLEYGGIYWIGFGRNFTSDRKWRWISGMEIPMSSPLWRDNNHDRKEEEDAGFFSPGFGLDSRKSEEQFSFICSPS